MKIDAMARMLSRLAWADAEPEREATIRAALRDAYAKGVRVGSRRERFDAVVWTPVGAQPSVGEFVVMHGPKGRERARVHAIASTADVPAAETWITLDSAPTTPVGPRDPRSIVPGWTWGPL